MKKIYFVLSHSHLKWLTIKKSVVIFGLIALLLTGLTSVSSAQGVMRGTITDDSNLPLPGVSVMVQNTTNGTITDIDGNYVLSNLNTGDVVIFSFIGMITQQITYSGQSEVNIQMLTDTKSLDEVVVTALGIQRDKKSLTYSSQQVTGEELMKTKDVNFMNSLAGKTAGLDVKKSSSGAGGSTRTVLRGSKSISGLSEPLYVIDGIPMINRKGGQPGMWGGTDQGDGLSQINPEDIESISILKGSNAAVLYGSEGANGVVIINTKKGRTGQTVVSASSSTVFESILLMPELQFTYGADGGQLSWSDTKGSYDDTFVDDFFETGHNLINTISISGGNARTTAYFSYGNTSNKGIVPKNTYSKHNVTFKQATKLFNDKVTVRSNVMISSESTKNRNPAGYYLNPLVGLYTFPRERDFDSYKENYEVFNVDRNMNLQNWFIQGDHFQSNPYWVINKEPREDLTKRLIAQAAIEWAIDKHWNIEVRGNVDYADKIFEQKHYAGSNFVNCSQNGRWQYQNYNDFQLYTDALLKYNNEFGDFRIDGVLGAVYSKTTLGKGVSVDNGTDALFYPNEFYFQNLPTNVQVSSTLADRRIKQGLLGTLTLGYKEMLFLDLAGRNEWASTLIGTGNESYFYPSVGISAIISEMLTMPTWVSYGKVRASHTTVANEVPWNRIHPQNTITASGGVSRNTQKPFTDLKPEMLKSLELGTEWSFFDNRLSFDFTYYDITSNDQFIELPAPSGSGFTTYFINAGEIVNKGYEVTLKAEPVRTENLTWTTVFNFDSNKNEIVEFVAEYPDRTFSYGSSEGYETYIKAGGSFGDLYGYKFKRNEAGQIMLNETTGAPLRTADREYLGNLNPDWSLGWNNTVTYKNFAVSVLINSRIGGKTVSQTESILDGYGVSKRTAYARDLGYVPIDAIQGTTRVNKLDPKLYYTTIGDRNGTLEPYVYDRTNIKLAQLAISYDFDVNALNIPVKQASISLIGQNLLFLYKKAPFDPELTMNTTNSSQSLDNFNLPSTRTYGFNVKFTF
ncbi:SusC/RagA family TonB-linked outer membrane protein [Maribellus luteus]|uniref:SusC/RagA family TonB-linked outer membrane protein n=1 Tax=Maribellus luteus TaxID=2305463 RepID=A0A399SRD8_9BACT|nr:SusC/RagA family TonB-linked outer membrane protein [Maribellus luteus]RIJ45459.1 SusC/RagA family TonB-linked outer membrane protein [Maribellus luteus]